MTECDCADRLDAAWHAIRIIAAQLEIDLQDPYRRPQLVDTIFRELDTHWSRIRGIEDKVEHNEQDIEDLMIVNKYHGKKLAQITQT